MSDYKILRTVADNLAAGVPVSDDDVARAIRAMKRRNVVGLAQRPVMCVVLQRGFVVVCRYAQVNETTVWGTHVYCLRHWTQEADLGGAVMAGRQGNTLSPQPETEWHPLTEVQRIRCPEELWAPIMEEHPRPYEPDDAPGKG